LKFDNLLWAALTLAQATLFALLVWRCVWKKFPFFSLLSAWYLLIDISAFLVLRSFSDSLYFRFYLGAVILSALLEFMVLYELGVSLFRPFRTMLPKCANQIIGGILLLLGILIWPFAVIPGFGNLPPSWHILIRVEQTGTILRILIFLMIALFSRFLAISARSRELQIAVGLGFYSMVGLVTALIRSHKPITGFYGFMNEMETIGYILATLYWIFSFARQEEAPKAASPQMETLLRRVAGQARAERESAVQAIQRKKE
jgi:hypothetical protein